MHSSTSDFRPVASTALPENDGENPYAGLCLHTVTTRPWAIETAIEKYAAAGLGGITIWRDAVEDRDPQQIGRRVREAGLKIVSLCRGGFFAAVDAGEREASIDDNRHAIDLASDLGAPLVVLVCGADPRQSLDDSRGQIEEALGRLAPYAAERGVRLGIEPLHPMYADTRSAINTLHDARVIAERVGDANVGVVLDVYHVWWDSRLEEELSLLGRARLFGYHICDWRVPTEHMLTDRGIMGEGCIPLETISGWVRATGFEGFDEVEIFSTRLWSQDQDTVLKRIKEAWHG